MNDLSPPPVIPVPVEDPSNLVSVPDIPFGTIFNDKLLAPAVIITSARLLYMVTRTMIIMRRGYVPVSHVKSVILGLLQFATFSPFSFIKQQLTEMDDSLIAKVKKNGADSVEPMYIATNVLTELGSLFAVGYDLMAENFTPLDRIVTVAADLSLTSLLTSRFIISYQMFQNRKKCVQNNHMKGCPAPDLFVD